MRDEGECIISSLSSGCDDILWSIKRHSSVSCFVLVVFLRLTVDSTVGLEECVYDMICISVGQYFFQCLRKLAVWLGTSSGELLVRRWIDEGHRGLTNETYAATPVASSE